jgi:hypothetical protein
MRMRMRMRMRVVLGVVLGVVLAACGAGDPTGDGAAPVGPALTPPAADAVPAPAPPDRVLVLEQLTAEQLLELGVVLEDGFSPHAHLRTNDSAVRWPPADQMPQGIGDPPLPEGLGPLVIEARIERFPISCVEWSRTIAGVDVGPGAAAARMAQTIVGVGASEQATFTAEFGVEADCAGLEPGSPVSIGSTYIELAEEPCALPGGPPVRCFVLAGFGFPPGAANTYLRHYQLVFDTRTGAQLELSDLYRSGGVDPEAGRGITADIVERITDTREVTLRQARPTMAGLVLGFSPYEAGSGAAGTRDVLVPWELLRELAGPAAAQP